MAKLTKDSVFKAQPSKPETPMDKTSRIVKKMIDDEADQRNVKIARLRKARLEREASTPATPAKPAKPARKKPTPKPAKKP